MGYICCVYIARQVLFVTDWIEVLLLRRGVWLEYQKFKYPLRSDQVREEVRIGEKKQ